jgi:peptidoglycan hydrolase CwlO-like protein
MARTLNPQIFGQQAVVQPTGQPQMQIMDSSPNLNARKMRELEVQNETLNQKIEKWVQILDGKIQKIQNSQKNLNDQFKMSTDNVAQQNAIILSKMNERRTADAKVQELVDRHNQLVHNFELRLNQLQKVTNEQEMKLMAYQSTYDEILREIRNLKR